MGNNNNHHHHMRIPGLVSPPGQGERARGQKDRLDSLHRAAGGVVIVVKGASVAVLAADAAEGGALVLAAEEVVQAGLTLRHGSCSLDGLEGLQAGAGCRGACEAEQEQRGPRRRHSKQRVPDPHAWAEPGEVDGPDRGGSGERQDGKAHGGAGWRNGCSGAW